MADMIPGQASLPDLSGNASTINPASSELLTRAPIKRARPQLSCTPCRQGKLKCSRQQPVCDQCLKRSRRDACTYVPPPPKNKQAQNMRGRIKNLENLVVNLIQNQKGPENAGQLASSNANNEPDTEPSAETFGRLRISNTNETSYVGAGHWSSLLKEIEGVKNNLDYDAAEEPEQEECNDAETRSMITFGAPKLMTKAQLIEAMPPKEDVDRLLPLWFNSADPTLYIIHAPTFQDEYREFWKNSSSVSAMWISLLYSMLALGVILAPRTQGIYDAFITPSHPYKKHDRARFQQLASSALVLADISKPQPYALETLMIYSECEFLRRDDHHAKTWLMNGVALRVAMRMGYHRDPSNFKGMSAFTGEMRRRVWHVINMMDVLVSFAIGLPSQLRRVESDTKVPRNLLDSDFSRDMTELPNGRPFTEATPALYVIAKSRVCAVFAEAAELAQKIVPPKYSTVMALDKRLEEAHDLIPEVMRVRPLEECITDRAVTIMGRFNIELLYLKTKSVLHRTFLTPGQTDVRFAESRKICIDAAQKILEYQKIIFHACQPGGQLNRLWWYMSSLQTYDFLLAAMILCLELNHLKSVDDSTPRISELYGQLEGTYNIWAHHPNRYKESVRGAQILGAMLKKLADPITSQSVLQDDAPPGYEQNISYNPQQSTPESMIDEQLPTSQIWGLQSSLVDPLPLSSQDVPSDIDWHFWDSTMQGQSNMLPDFQPSFSTNNAAMESWIGATANVDNLLGSGNGFLDPIDPLNAYGASSIFDIPPDMPQQ